MKYYTSDLHFSHEAIIRLCNRPFTSADEMNRKIISNFCERLGKDDFLFILGDVSCYGQHPQDLIKQIPGHKILIKGNHDKSLIKDASFRHCFTDIVTNEIVRDQVDDEDVKIFLSHYPMAEWDGFYKWIWHFYGHVHNSPSGGAAVMQLIPTAVNVGVDTNAFTPKTAKELISDRRNNYRMPDTAEIADKILHPYIKDTGARKLKLSQFKNL